MAKKDRNLKPSGETWFVYMVVGDGSWVDMAEPIIVQAGDVFIVEPDPEVQ